MAHAVPLNSKCCVISVIESKVAEFSGQFCRHCNSASYTPACFDRSPPLLWVPDEWPLTPPPWMLKLLICINYGRDVWWRVDEQAQVSSQNDNLSDILEQNKQAHRYITKGKTSLRNLSNIFSEKWRGTGKTVEEWGHMFLHFSRKLEWRALMWRTCLHNDKLCEQTMSE